MEQESCRPGADDGSNSLLAGEWVQSIKNDLEKQFP